MDRRVKEKNSGPGGSLHLRIRDEVESKIRSGKWRPGYRIPSEKELVESYRCSRMTVNKVLSALASEGLIERRRRAGSFVSRPRVQSAVLQIPDLRAVVEDRGEKYQYSLLRSERRAASRQDKVLICRHEANGQPFALEDRLINLRAVPDAATVDFSQIPPSPWLLGHVPWTQAQHRISAVNADKAMSAALHIPIGFACLMVERLTWQNGEPITSVRLIHPGNLYDLVAPFTPSRLDRREIDKAA
jgi:GntR family histidine utilization transcriptional repressor